MSKILKPITEFTAAELLDLVKENPQQTLNYDHPNDVMDFIAIYRLKEGDNRVYLPVIYNMYRKWSKNPLHRNPFGKEMTKFFPSIKHGQATAYLLNHSKEFFLEKSITKKRNKTKYPHYYKHFKKFINKFDLKSGSFYIKDIVLYNLYDRWTYKNGNKNPLSFNQFLKFCKLFFSKPAPKMIRGNRWFSMDSKLKGKLTPDLINLMRNKWVKL
jgi:hypothetical protein